MDQSKLPDLSNLRIAVIGLGYVGLPLSVEFGKVTATIGYDINPKRIAELESGEDKTLEVSPDELNSANYLTFTSNASQLIDANVYIITVPTPIDNFKNPDLTPLRKASETVGSVLRKGNVVIYESTVYPGATEEVCAPILASTSGLTLNSDFSLGYSPERINPGDRLHSITNITKVTSGSTPATATFVDQLYQLIVTAGTFKAASIKVAEAAKVIENTQRDLNIALINELSLIFNLLNIDTQSVLEAAATKWNFLSFKPGLVGGHCIGVDPYYLTHKAQAIGYHPEVILAGRRINDSMGPYVAEQVIKQMTKRKKYVVDSNILVLGLSFKENCPDFRNTRTIDVIRELKSYHAKVDIYDPWIDPNEASKAYQVELTQDLKEGTYDAIILTVAHKEFLDMGSKKIRALGKQDAILFDVKGILPKAEVDARL